MGLKNMAVFGIGGRQEGSCSFIQPALACPQDPKTVSPPSTCLLSSENRPGWWVGANHAIQSPSVGRSADGKSDPHGPWSALWCDFAWRNPLVDTTSPLPEEREMQVEAKRAGKWAMMMDDHFTIHALARLVPGSCRPCVSRQARRAAAAKRRQDFTSHQLTGNEGRDVMEGSGDMKKKKMRGIDPAKAQACRLIGPQ